MITRNYFALLAISGITFGLAASAHADLQQITTGGKMVILGEYYRNVIPADDGLRWPSYWLLGRPVGNGNEIGSGFGWDDRGYGLAQTSQWTRLHLKADLSGNVGAYVELDRVNVWGDAFRSDYLTGSDFRSDTDQGVALYQAYVEANEVGGAPLRLRIGRQEIQMGNGWLVGANDDGPAPSWGLSFDAIRLTYESDPFSLDIWTAKLAERNLREEDADTDFYGLYGSYSGMESIVIDAYWLWIRDASAMESTQLGLVEESLEHLLHLDTYENNTNLHTLGARVAGNQESLDFEVEVAHQWGDAAQLGSRFTPVRYGDEKAEHDSWGCNLELGYSLNIKGQPRLYAGYAYLGGEDQRDISFAQWVGSLFNPLYAPEASVSFNRLFSNHSYSGILDGTDMSNAHIVHCGVEFTPTETLEIGIDWGWYRVAAPFHRPLLPFLGFLSTPNDANLGMELDTNITYHYSEALQFTIGWDHLFVGDGLRQGHFTVANGLDFNGGSREDDADYFYFETGISF